MRWQSIRRTGAAPRVAPGQSTQFCGASRRRNTLGRVLAAILMGSGLSACAGATAVPESPAEAVEIVSDQTGQPDAEILEQYDGEIQENPLQPVRRPDNELYILELRLRDIVLTDGLFGYVDGSTLLLPLGGVAHSLDFPINVDPVSGRAHGWFLSEKRLFSIDLARGEVVVEGRKGTFNPNLVELHDDDIYVDSRLLARWFPVDFEFDLSNSLVQVRSREPLPVETRRAREEIRAAIGDRAREDGPEYELIETPYQWASMPFFDFSTEGGYRRDDATGETVSGRYNGLITADLLKMNASMFIAGDTNDSLSRVRLQMGRKDPEGELFGPLHVTEFTLGDVAGPKMTLISRSRFGRGAEISSFPIEREGEFSRTNLIGDLPLGWDVELYRNEVLIDFQSARADGRYEFIDVPLLFGVNVLRLEFFGPQGQRRRETSRILVGANQVDEGKFNFRLAANQQETDLIPVRDDPVTTTESELEGEGRFFAQAEYGITSNFSIAGGAGSIPLLSGRRTYGTFGVRAGFGPTFTELDVVGDDKGGKAGRVATQFSLPGNLAMLLEHGQYQDFISEDADDVNGLLQSRTKLRLDGVIGIGSLPRMPFSLTGSHDRREGGYEQTEVGNRLSVAIGRLAVSNSLTWQNIHQNDTDTVTANGNLLIGGRLARASLRGEMQYSIEPESHVDSATLTGDWSFNANTNGRLSVQRVFTAPTRTVYGAGISRRFEWASVGVTAEYGSDDSVSALLTVSFGLGRDPRSGSWYGSADPVAEKGAVSARAFLDTNVNGVYDEGDQALEGVRFEANGGIARRATDADGTAFISGLPVHETVEITLPPRRLDDPYWVARPEGISVTPRPGRTTVVDFPIVTTGEIDGTVYITRNGIRQEVADVVLQLVGEDGEVVATEVSAYDGFYLFELVSPGEYLVQVDPEQLARLELTASEPRTVTINGDGTIAGGVEFIVYPAR